MRKYSVKAAALVVPLVLTAGARADIIDFESGLVDGQQIGAIATATNVATFSLGDGTNAFVVAVGAPGRAFAPNDSPVNGNPGQFFISDDHTGSGGQGPAVARSLDYFIDFAAPIVDLSLDVYDFVGDGGAVAGDRITLELYADAARTILVGSDFFQLANPPGLPDGDTLTLSAVAQGGYAVAASVIYRVDVGTGIDNISFTTVPEPGLLTLFGAGLLALSVATRRRG